MGIITGTNYVSQYSGDEIDAALTAATNAGQVNGVLEGAGDGTFSAKNVDASPTMGSDALVESGGVYTALQGKQDALTFDNAPVEGSVNPVKSGGIYNSVEELRGLIYDLMPRNSLPSAALHAFADGADGIPIKAMSVAVSAVQSGSGDPSPDNVRPISGWSEAKIVDNGINQWDEVTESGAYNMNTGAAIINASSIRGKNPFNVVGGESYYLNSDKLRLLWYDKSGAFISSVYGPGVKTAPSNAFIAKVFMSDAYGTTYNHDISINYPSTDTSYHAYNGSLVTIAFGSTVYGGQLVYKGGLEWEFTAIHAFVTFDGSDDESWTFESGSRQYARGMLPAQVNYTEQTAPFPAISNIAQMVDQQILYSSFTYAAVGGNAGNRSQVRFIYAGVTDVGTVSDFRTWLSNNNLQLCYELYSPTTVTLTADAECVTQYGDNVMFADCGDSELTYRQDIGLLHAE